MKNEDYYIMNSKPIRKAPPVSIAALSWAAEKAGMSYGKFTMNLTHDEQLRIQREWDAYQAELRESLKERSAEHRLAESREGESEDDAYIISDMDL